MADADRLDPLREVAARYAVAITPDMEALIDPADPADPIARTRPSMAWCTATPIARS